MSVIRLGAVFLGRRTDTSPTMISTPSKEDGEASGTTVIAAKLCELAFSIPDARLAAVRQDDNCDATIPCRCATSATRAPGWYVCATIAARSAGVRRTVLRRPSPLPSSSSKSPPDQLEVRVSHRQKPRYQRVYAPLTIEAPIVSGGFVKKKIYQTVTLSAHFISVNWVHSFSSNDRSHEPLV